MSVHAPGADTTRRRILAAMLGLTSFLLPRGGRAASRAGDEGLRQQFDAVRKWGCQYQNIDVERIAASDLDLIVLEPSLNDDALQFISADQVEALKRKPDGSRRIVLGYMSIGEADTKRWFWPQAWRDNPPDWLGPENRQWPGSHPVRYWDREWQELLLGPGPSQLEHLLATGYDGALLDRVDAFEDWRSLEPQAPERMVDLISAIARQARAQRPGFLLVPQNAEPLLENRRYRRTIDGLNKESLLTGLHGRNSFNQPDEVAWSLGYFDLARQQGLKLLATEYATDEKVAAKAADRLRELGFAPFVGRRELDRFPSTGGF
ncbi:MAG: endo alpha-1,4 polygalactosaminidase [Nitratireductor sp.]|nr:endo alpha-1,4 polygalactosaminidase [Nitratireductor sp.]